MNADHATTTIQHAIDDSIRESRVVALRAVMDSENFVRLANGLAAIAEDWVETEQGCIAPYGTGRCREYWGFDDDDEDWRIDLYF
jgi:hypothetical protein